MNPNAKIAIYYISTGDYKKLFPDFLKSVHNFFPNNQKIIKIISDGLEEYNHYEENNIRIMLCPRINNYPHPIILLYKMWHILENIDEKFEYSCFFNGNSVIHEHADDVFNLTKLTVSYHSFNTINNDYSPWDYIKLDKDSVAYLENGTYEYVQSGFFFGPTNLVKKMCTDVVDMLNQDMRKLKFAQWHDESYLNKWVVLNKNQVDIKYIMTVFENDVDLYRFISLRDKRDYNIKK